MRRVHASVNPTLFVLLVALLPGCSDNKANWSNTDDGKIGMLMAGFEDATGRVETLQSAFTADAKITEADRIKYAENRVVMGGPVRFENGQAIIPVKIKNREGKELGQKEWIAVKDGESWKLKSAPL